MPTTANTKSNLRQGNFQLRAKTRMLEMNISVSAIARRLGKNRNTVSRAINNSMFEPTRKEIADILNIAL